MTQLPAMRSRTRLAPLSWLLLFLLSICLIGVPALRFCCSPATAAAVAAAAAAPATADARVVVVGVAVAAVAVVAVTVYNCCCLDAIV